MVKLLNVLLILCGIFIIPIILIGGTLLLIEKFTKRKSKNTSE
jgi:hypothetical protein